MMYSKDETEMWKTRTLRADVIKQQQVHVSLLWYFSFWGHCRGHAGSWVIRVCDSTTVASHLGFWAFAISTPFHFTSASLSRVCNPTRACELELQTGLMAHIDEAHTTPLTTNRYCMKPILIQWLLLCIKPILDIRMRPTLYHVD